MDRRDDILNDIRDDSKFSNINEVVFSVPEAKEAMDEYMRLICFEILEYMAKNSIECVDSMDGYRFLYKGQFITKEELFSNFL